MFIKGISFYSWDRTRGRSVIRLVNSPVSRHIFYERSDLYICICLSIRTYTTVGWSDFCSSEQKFREVTASHGLTLV